jgi:hypothetical protein
LNAKVERGLSYTIIFKLQALKPSTVNTVNRGSTWGRPAPPCQYAERQHLDHHFNGENHGEEEVDTEENVAGHGAVD